MLRILCQSRQNFASIEWFAPRFAAKGAWVQIIIVKREWNGIAWRARSYSRREFSRHSGSWTPRILSNIDFADVTDIVLGLGSPWNSGDGEVGHYDEECHYVG